MQKLRVAEFFSGIGAQSQALKNIGINFEVVATSDWNVGATLSYEAIHCDSKINHSAGMLESDIDEYLYKTGISNDGKKPLTLAQIKKTSMTKKKEIYNAFQNSNNMGSILNIDANDVPDCDLLTYSFPCTSVSLSGSMEGLTKGSGTSSSLLWECQKIIEAKMPKYLLMENVKNLVGKKFKPEFDKWTNYLDGLGYKSFWKVINAKNQGIPQNRERVFLVSILDEKADYNFPDDIPLDKKLKDMLDATVDEKYYISQDKVDKLLAKVSYIEPTPEDKIIQVGNIVDTGNWENPQRGRVYSPEGISPTVVTVTGGGLEAKVLIKNATSKGYLEAEDGDGIDLSYPDSKTRRGRVQKQMSHTIQTQDSLGVLLEYRIRKITPRECWRLMGFKDAQFEKAEELHSNSSLYKQAGNSIVVNVLEGIFNNLFQDYKLEKQEKKEMARPNKTIAVLDFETTGFSAISNEPTEIAIVLLDSQTGEEMGSFDALIKIDGYIPAKVTELTGITKDMLDKYGMDKQVVKNYVQAMLSDTIVVAHNVQFDFAFLKEHFGVEPKFFYDTVVISRQLFPSERSHALGNICNRAGINLTGAHRAINDTRATAELLNLQLNKDGVAQKYINTIDKKQGVKFQPENTREVL